MSFPIVMDSGKSMSEKVSRGYAWLVFSLCSFFVFYKYILEVSPNVIGKHIIEYYHITAADLGVFLSVYFYAYMLMQLPLGALLDRFGPKRVMSVCLLFCVMGAFALAHAHQFSYALWARFLTGLGAAVAVLGGLSLLRCVLIRAVSR